MAAKPGSGRGRKRVRTDEAGEEYQRHHPDRCWQDDIVMGVVAAVVAQFEVINATRGAALERAVFGEEELPVDIPRWFYRWFPLVRDRCRDDLRAKPELIDNPIMRLFSLPVCDRAFLSDPDAAQVPLALDAELDLRSLRLLQAARTDYDKLRREERGLRAFYEGVRNFFERVGRAVPTARDIALLAAAGGLESLEPSLNDTRRRWENRIGRWQREREGPA